MLKMKVLFLGIVLVLTAAQASLAAKSVKLDSAKIKDCFILGYCDVLIMDIGELPRGWQERQLSQPTLRIRIQTSMRRTNLLVEMFQGKAGGNSLKTSSKVLHPFTSKSMANLKATMQRESSLTASLLLT